MILILFLIIFYCFCICSFVYFFFVSAIDDINLFSSFFRRCRNLAMISVRLLIQDNLRFQIFCKDKVNMVSIQATSTSFS